MKYENFIINLLMEVGPNGLPFKSIVAHVYNAHNTFFSPVSESSVYQAVRSFLLKRAVSQNSFIIKGEDGRYRFNPDAPQYSTQMLPFVDEEEENIAQNVVEEPVIPFFFD